jgi:hypothetical protein
MDVSNIQKLSMSLEIEKVIFLISNELMNDNAYLSKLISMGIYNFAANKESLMYLYNHPNTYKDVAHIHQLGMSNSKEDNKKSINDKDEKPQSISDNGNKIIGFKSVTQGAGATTLIYMIKKALSEKDYVVAIEVNKNDFGFFAEKDMYSVTETNLKAAIDKFDSASLILVDLNNTSGDLCNDIVYLIEPSIIKLNKMIAGNKDIFETLYDKKIILNKSLLTDRDVKDFEFESHSTITYNLPPLNDREDNNDKLKDLIDIIKEQSN